MQKDCVVHTTNRFGGKPQKGNLVEKNGNSHLREKSLAESGTKHHLIKMLLEYTTNLK